MWWTICQKLLVIYYWSVYWVGVHFQVEFYLQIDINCFLNRGLKWKSLDWKLIVLSAFFSRIDTIDSTEILHPNHIGIINMWVKDCIIYGFRSVDIDKIPDLKRESIFSIQFYCNIRNMVFAVQIFINPNVKIFNRICGIESLSI